MSDKVDAYLHTVGLLEPDIHPVDQDAALTSLAISMKRIADSYEKVAVSIEKFTVVITQFTEYQIQKDLGR